MTHLRTVKSLLRSEHGVFDKARKDVRLTGADPSKEALALENDKFPAKNEPPF
jgi:hypothetical protein